ncbi:MAG: type III pantothenate kinase [Flavobacteriaceae bacterium]|nr:type III pantothenate kinase [Flavobacteriaceae bacterium]
MNLIIDVGNTKAKIAIFSKGKLLRKNSLPHAELKPELKSWIKKYKSLKKVIIASVGPIKDTHFNYLPKSLEKIIVSSKTGIPFTNKYNTPKTLGVDRVALVAAAARLYPKKNVLVIDAGSCITFDFINSKNEYLGGAISPGIRLRYEALHNFTANLPLLDAKMPANYLGRSTNSSIHSGVIYGLINEIQGVIDTYKENWSDLTVILTGGDAKLLSKRLKNSIFANPNFLLIGLNEILEFNT